MPYRLAQSGPIHSLSLMIRRLLSYFLKKRKAGVSPIDAPTLEAAFRRLKSRQIDVGSVIDVGASNGCWTRALMPHFPQARYLCVEAQAVHEPELLDFAAKNDNVEIALAAAGDREGAIHFDAADPFGGAASEAPLTRNGITVPMTTIDAEVSRRNLQPPYLIKLDTHGFEMPILAGAVQTLKHTNVLVIEVYNFDIAPSTMRFPELCVRLEAQGFRCADLFDVMYRPKDNTLWQMDLVFIRSDRAEFRTNTYS